MGERRKNPASGGHDHKEDKTVEEYMGKNIRHCPLLNKYLLRDQASEHGPKASKVPVYKEFSTLEEAKRAVKVEKDAWAVKHGYKSYDDRALVLEERKKKKVK